MDLQILQTNITKIYGNKLGEFIFQENNSSANWGEWMKIELL